MIKSIRNLDYEERLKVFNLPSLHYRHYRGDMIVVYNMLHDKYDIGYSDFLLFHPLPIPEVTHLSYSDLFLEQMPGNIFLTRRVVEPWNNLPQQVVCAASVDDFKKLIDQFSSNTMCVEYM